MDLADRIQQVWPQQLAVGAVTEYSSTAGQCIQLTESAYHFLNTNAFTGGDASVISSTTTGSESAVTQVILLLLQELQCYSSGGHAGTRYW